MLAGQQQIKFSAAINKFRDLSPWSLVLGTQSLSRNPSASAFTLTLHLHAADIILAKVLY
jgi:hypothetical protein